MDILYLFKKANHKAVGIEDMLPAVVLFGLIAIVAAVVALILSGFQSTAIISSGGAAGSTGGYGEYGVIIQANSVVNPGNIITTGGSAKASANGGLGGGGGAGAIWIVFNSIYSNTGTVSTTGGTGSGNGGGASVSLFGYNGVSGKTAPIPYVVFGVGTACANNLASGSCTGSVTYTQTTVLTGDINVSNDIIVSSGVTLRTAGYSILAGNSLQNLGTIAPGGGAGFVAYTGGAAGTGTSSGQAGSGNAISSYGGSGGGGQGCFTSGGNGGNSISNGGIGGTGTSGSTCNAGTSGSAPAGKSITTNAIFLAAVGGAGMPLTAMTVNTAGASGGGQGTIPSQALNATLNGNSAISTLTSFLSLIALVIVASIIIGIVLLAFSFGRGGQGGRQF